MHSLQVRLAGRFVNRPYGVRIRRGGIVSLPLLRISLKPCGSHTMAPLRKNCVEFFGAVFLLKFTFGGANGLHHKGRHGRHTGILVVKVCSRLIIQLRVGGNNGFHFQQRLGAQI